MIVMGHRDQPLTPPMRMPVDQVRWKVKKTSLSALNEFWAVGTCGRLPRAARPGPRLRLSIAPSVLPPGTEVRHKVANAGLAGIQH